MFVECDMTEVPLDAFNTITGDHMVVLRQCTLDGNRQVHGILQYQAGRVTHAQRIKWFTPTILDSLFLQASDYLCLVQTVVSGHYTIEASEFVLCKSKALSFSAPHAIKVVVDFCQQVVLDMPELQYLVCNQSDVPLHNHAKLEYLVLTTYSGKQIVRDNRSLRQLVHSKHSNVVLQQSIGHVSTLEADNDLFYADIWWLQSKVASVL
jgi:hypothetical protein